MNAKPEIVTLDEDDTVLNSTERDIIREALVLGLACLGEVQKAAVAFKIAQQINGKRPEWFDFRDPGNGDATSRFADALLVLR